MGPECRIAWGGLDTSHDGHGTPRGRSLTTDRRVASRRQGWTPTTQNFRCTSAACDITLRPRSNVHQPPWTAQEGHSCSTPKYPPLFRSHSLTPSLSSCHAQCTRYISLCMADPVSSHHCWAYPRTVWTVWLLVLRHRRLPRNTLHHGNGVKRWKGGGTWLLSHVRWFPYCPYASADMFDRQVPSAGACLQSKASINTDASTCRQPSPSVEPRYSHSSSAKTRNTGTD